MAALARAAALAGLAAGALACAQSPAGPALELPASVTAIEARFGERYCRRIEDPAQLEELGELVASHATGWQPTWKEPPPPQVTIDFYDGDSPVLRLGLGDGQLLTTLEERTFFQPLAAAGAEDLIRRAGGQPAGAPAIPCRPAGDG